MYPLAFSWFEARRHTDATIHFTKGRELVLPMRFELMTSVLPRLRSTARAMAANYDFVCISDSTEPKKFDQNHPILVSHTMIEFVVA